MVRGVFALTDPDGVEGSLTVTMPLRQWKELASQLDTKYPSWQLAAMIRELVAHATQRFDQKVVHEP